MVIIVPGRDQLDAACAALRGVVVETPLVRSPALEELTGAVSVHVKVESLQRTGSFKFRGAYWRCLQLTDAERKRGIVAYSSGNFAQGLAAAAQLLEISCTIVMPVDAPEVKRSRTESYGATVICTEHGDRPREEVASKEAQRIARDEKRTLLHPFDDPAIVTGHASLAYEVLDEFERAGAPVPDDILCNVGGGGLFAGIALGCHVRGVGTRCTPVEPFGFDSMGQSLQNGFPVRIGSARGTICDALQAIQPGNVPFKILKACGYGGPLSVNDAAVLDAIRFSYDILKIVVEPSGAVALAAMLGSKDQYHGRRVVVVLTGGNIEIGALADLIA